MKPRIWHKTAIETAGNVIGGADASSVLPGDFVLPSDEPLEKPLVVSFVSIDFFAAVGSVHSSVGETATPLTGVTDSPNIQAYSAKLKFKVEADGEEHKSFHLALANDIQFVTAHPCVPSSHTDVLKSPTSPSFHANESPTGSPWLPGSPAATSMYQCYGVPSCRLRLELTTFLGGHPLHKAFTYSRLHVLDLLATPSSLPFSSLLSPPQSPDPTQSSTHTTSSSIPKVLVIDCTDATTTNLPPRPMPSPHVGHKHKFGSDMEMLARALCAERGWNALVSRRGRGCLSCAVREASAIGWRVVLRLA